MVSVVYSQVYLCVSIWGNLIYENENKPVELFIPYVSLIQKWDHQSMNIMCIYVIFSRQQEWVTFRVVNIL